MKKLLIASVALMVVAGAAPALAADLPVYKAPPPPPLAYSWSGCYIGANVGADRVKNYADTSPAGNYLTATGAAAPPNAQGTGDFANDITFLTDRYSSTGTGFEGGGQIGCNKQFGVVVVGLEGDFQWTSVNTSVDAAFAAFPNLGNAGFTDAARTEHVDIKKDWYSTIRVRAGYAMDRVLFYDTVGIAFAHYSSNTDVAFGTFPVAPVFNGALHLGSGSATPTGVVVGSGIEWAINNNWTVKAEYLYMWFGGGWNYASPLTAAVPAFAPGYAWNTNINNREQVLRVGVNYKFDWAGPVVTRY